MAQKDILAQRVYDLIRASAYQAIWSIADKLETSLDEVEIAIGNLVEAGLIEELPDLHCRYRVIEVSNV